MDQLKRQYVFNVFLYIYTHICACISLIVGIYLAPFIEMLIRF